MMRTTMVSGRTHEGWLDAARDHAFLLVLQYRVLRDQGDDDPRTDDVIRNAIVADLLQRIRDGRWNACGPDALDAFNIETMMAAYQRGIDEALAMDFDELYQEYGPGSDWFS